MNRADILKTADDESDKLLAARLIDFISDARDKYCVRFTAFLDIHKQSIAEQIFKQADYKYFLFFGGLEKCERKIAAVYSEDFSGIEFPVKYILIKSSMLSKLSHRDYLGTLMSLGIKREMIGDIIISDEKTVIVVISDIADYIITSIDKIGGIGVKLSICTAGDIPFQKDSFEEKTDFVSSLRLDSIVSAFANIPRSKAKELVESALVFVDGREVAKSDSLISCGSAVTIRGRGKFILDEVFPLKKKDRLRISFRKYR